MNLHPNSALAHLLGTLLTTCICVVYAWAQPCTCTNCPQPIPTVSDFQVCYDVHGLTNTTLGANAQGVCGVTLSFTHDYIENLSLTLISPAGQQVQLLGPGITGISSIPTAGSRWNVNFVECGSPASPFPGTGPNFDGSNTNWQLLGNYTGSYYPFLGCLSNFNTGAVNGQWCLRVQSSAQVTNNDRLIDFGVEFCDDSGAGCCTAEIPVWTDLPSDTIVCSGDSTLNFGLTYAASGSTGYQERIIVSRNNLVYSYESSSVDLRLAPPGRYSICAIEYWSGDAGSLPSIGDPFSTLAAAVSNGDICAELSISCREIIIVPTPSLTRIEEEICQGDSVLYNGNWYDSQGAYSFTYTSVGGCDSLVELALTVFQPDSTSFRENLCQGDTLVFNGLEITSGGNYQFDLLTSEGCDSTVRLEVIEYPSYLIARDTAFCDGEALILGQDTITTSGAFRQNLTSVNGCDSIIDWTIYRLSAVAQIIAGDTLLTCLNNSIQLNSNSVSTPSGVSFTRTWTSPQGVFTSDPSVEATTLGFYVLSHELSFAGISCVSLDSIQIFEDSDVALVIVQDTATLSCSTDTIVLSANSNDPGNYQFEWSQAGSTISIDSSLIIRTGGVYTVIGTRLDNGCMDTVQVSIGTDLSSPVLTINQPDTLSCIVDSVHLDASSSGLPNVNLQWFASDNSLLPTSGGIADATDPGIYYLLGSNSSNGCTSIDSIEVIVDTTSFSFIIPTPDTLTCAVQEVILSAQTGEPASIYWISSIGDTLSINDTLPVIQAGDFQVIAVSEINGCSLSQNISVFADTIRPVVRIQVPDTLRCFPPIAVLDASASSGLGPLRFEWNSSSTEIITGFVTPFLTTAGGGVYTVVVTDLRNGCIDSASVDLIEDRPMLVADAGIDGRIDCSNNSVSLGGSATTVGPNISYSWQAITGRFVGFSDQLTVTAVDSGIYVLSVRDGTTGCLVRDSVVVTKAQGVPTVIILDTLELSCGNNQITLESSGSSIGSEFIYQWSTLDGSILSGDTTPSVNIDGVGIYRLTITDTISQCSSYAETIITDDCLLAVVVSSPDTITCFTGPEIMLEAIGSVGPRIQISWSTLDGQVVSGGDSYTPTIRGGGLYFVQLTEPGSSPVFDSVEVIVDTLAPRANVLGDLLLSCSDVSSCVELNGSGSTARSSVLSSWSTVGGRFCADTLGFSVRINAPGLYEILLLDTLNGCVSSSLVNVVTEPDVLVPDAGRDRILLCDQPSVSLFGGIPTDTAGLSWFWTNELGEVIQDSNRVDIQLDSAGIYAFVITDAATGCVAADSVAVITQYCAPNARPQALGIIDCLHDSIQLSTPLQSGMLAVWSGPNGSPAQLSGFTVQVSEPGSYQVIVIDTSFLVADTASITIIDNRIQPWAIANSPGELTCSIDSVLLDGRLSQDTLGGGLAYEWFNSSGTGVGTSSTAFVQEPGFYTLIITSQRTGCADTATTTILIDTLAPNSLAMSSGNFDCNSSIITLDASSSSGQGSLSYIWEGIGGQTVLGINSSVASVREAGEYLLTVQDDDNGCIAMDTIVVVDLRTSSVFAGTDTLISCSATGVILASASIQPGGSYRWLGPASCFDDVNQLNPTVSCAGDFILEYTSADGACVYADTVIVAFQTADLGLEISGDTVITCTNRQAVLQASSTVSRVSFTWFGANPSSDSSATSIQAGMVQLIGIDSSSCQDTFSIQVRVDTLQPLLGFTEPDTLTCRNREVLLQVSDVNGRLITSQWTGAGIIGSSSGNTIRVNQPGLYAVQVTDSSNGCTSSGDIQIERDTASPIVQLRLPEGRILDCNVDRLLVEATVAPINSSIRWTGPSGQQFQPSAFRQNISIGGIYQLTATHPETGCSTSRVEVISDIGTPVSGYSLDVDGVLGCQDESVALSSTLPVNVVIEWSNALNDPIDPTLVETAGVYTAFLRDTLTGCRVIDSIIVEYYQPTFGFTVLLPDTIGCSETSTTLEVETNGQVPATVRFSWISPAGDTILTNSVRELEVNQAGLWTVVAENGEDNCSQQQEIDVLITAEAIREVIFSVEDATCPGERNGLIEITAIEGGTSPFEFSLSGSQTQAVGQFGLLEGGLYELIIRDANGCETERSIRVGQSEQKNVEIESRYVGIIGDTICITPFIEGITQADSTRWFPSEMFVCDTCSTGCVLAEADGEIGVSLWFEGCEVRLLSRIELKDSEGVVWANGFSPNGDGINDTWTVQVTEGEINQIRVYDRWGSIVFSTIVLPGQLPPTWDGSHLGKPLNPATFVVEVVGTRASGEIYRIYGDVTLLH